MSVKIDPYLHAALLLQGAGKEVNESGISSVLKAGGVEVDSAKAKVLAEALKGVNWDDVMKASSAPVAVAAVAAAPAEGKKKEEKKEEDEGKKEEAAAEGLASLFG